MHTLLAPFVQGVELAGDVRADMTRLLTRHGYPKTVGHCVRVAAEAKRLAARFGQDEAQAEIAGWLHDVSAVIPLERRVTLAQQLGIEVLQSGKRPGLTWAYMDTQPLAGIIIELIERKK